MFSTKIWRSKWRWPYVSADDAPVSTQVPIQFEFEIEVTKSHPHFKISPLRGMVPANGAVEVLCDYNSPIRQCFLGSTGYYILLCAVLETGGFERIESFPALLPPTLPNLKHPLQTCTLKQTMQEHTRTSPSHASGAHRAHTRQRQLGRDAPPRQCLSGDYSRVLIVS